MKIQKHGYNLLMALAVPALAAVALMNLGVVADASSCQIWWGPAELTCKQAEGAPNNGHFSYGQTTTWGSAAKGTWTVTQAMSALLGTHVTNVSCSPTSAQVGDNGGLSNGDIVTSCQGDLDDPSNTGTSTLNAWDSTGEPSPECSGGHSVTVKPHNGPGC